MSIEYENETLKLGLDKLRAVGGGGDVIKALAEGAAIILKESDELVPKRSGDLVGTGKVREDRGGDNTVGITYDGPYARWIHEHTYFKHPNGGQAKFLEQAAVTKKDEALAAIAAALKAEIESGG